MKNYTVTVNGVAYNVTVEEGASTPAPQPVQTVQAPSAPVATVNNASQGNIKIEAPMPGNVLDIKVKVGDTVSSGDSVLILEAMKMENEIVSPSDGTIASVNVNKGDSVEAGQLLITLS
ncbi:MAG: biotin/lipoyl-binding protein [Eubacterium sp.]|nr:biotin/lipoyl-binding protein [Eubacterium sp.]